MELLTTENLVALLTLTALEIVLGIDNVIFVAILAGKLPEHLYDASAPDEVLDFLARYDLASIPGYFEQGQMLWTDRFGGSVIVEGDVVIHRSGTYQIITNFLHSRPDLGGWPCPRYQLIEGSLAGQGYSGRMKMIHVSGF